MPSLPALSIYAFGLTSLLAGLHNLLSPASALVSLELPDSALPASNGLALAATAMGIYYVLGAYQENRPFFVMTVPMRLLTTTVFLRQGGAPWRVAALWEGTGAALTAAALGWGLLGYSS